MGQTLLSGRMGVKITFMRKKTSFFIDKYFFLWLFMTMVKKLFSLYYFCLKISVSKPFCKKDNPPKPHLFQNQLALLFLSSFVFVSQAEVQSIYHRGNKIYIKYNAEYEFSADLYLSALEEEKRQVSRLRPDLTDFRRKQCVIFPVCSNSDQICLQYVREVENIRKNIKAGFQRERILYEQKQANIREAQIYEENRAYNKASIERGQLWLRDINKIQDFLLAFIDDQSNMLSILQQFKTAHPELEYENKNIEQQIAEIKDWIEEHYPHDTILFSFLDEIERILDNQNQDKKQLISNLYNILLNDNPEILIDSFLDFIHETKRVAEDQMHSFADRSDEIRRKDKVNEIQRQNIERERIELWDTLKTQSARRVYPSSSGYSIGPSCRNCLIP